MNMNALDILMDTGWTKPNAYYKFQTFPTREESHREQNKLIVKYRAEGDEESYMELLKMMIPVIFSTMKKFKFTDHVEFKLVCLETFTVCINTYNVSEDLSEMLFSGYFQMRLKFAALDHLNHYVEDRQSVVKMGKSLETFAEETQESEYDIKDLKFYLALDKLTKRERQVITMHFFEGKGEKEIIDELGIGERSFPVYLSKSKKAFREAYLEVIEDDLLQLSDEEMEM
jgi:RNA polymerase sigma factor (sigma-70 family)